jgi:hypothetical protein
MRLKRALILFWNATSPVNLKSRDEISPKISPLRRRVREDFAAVGALSMRRHSSRKVPMQDVTIGQASISAEQSETRKMVSSFDDAAVRSGMSSDV